MRNVIITDGKAKLRAILNDTLAARDFEKRLPFTCSGSDSGTGYCCSAAGGLYDPMETQTGWKNGDISPGGGWFTLLYGGEESSEAYRDMMIIGKVLKDDLDMVKKLPERVMLTVSANREDQAEKKSGS